MVLGIYLGNLLWFRWLKYFFVVLDWLIKAKKSKKFQTNGLGKLTTFAKKTEWTPKKSY